MRVDWEKPVAMTLGNRILVPPPKVLLVGPSISGDGAQLRFRNIATHLFCGANDVVVLTSGSSLEPQISGGVVDLGWNGRLSYPKLVWRLRNILRCQRYDVLMAFGLFPSLVSIVASMFLRGCRTKLVISEITRPEMEARSRRGRIYNFLRRILYPRSALITANSIDGLRETCILAGVPVVRGVRVFNVIDGNLLKNKAVADVDCLPQGKYVVCVARLDFMKRIDTVVDAFAVLAAQSDCGLMIIGDGKARSALEAQVERIGLQHTVRFTGRLENPLPILRRAAAFVLASEYEGFSNSVLEAMFCDVPVITSLCSSDAREMCDQGAALGFEVGDYKQLANHIAAVLTNETLSQKLVQRAREHRAPHAVENAIPFYEDLIRKVAYGSAASPSFGPKL